MSNTELFTTKSTQAELRVLVALLDGPKTRAELNLYPSGDHYYLVKKLEADGLVKLGRRPTGKRGQPPTELKLVSKGRKRAKRAAEKVAA